MANNEKKIKQLEKKREALEAKLDDMYNRLEEIDEAIGKAKMVDEYTGKCVKLDSLGGETTYIKIESVNRYDNSMTLTGESYHGDPDNFSYKKRGSINIGTYYKANMLAVISEDEYEKGLESLISAVAERLGAAKPEGRSDKSQI